MRSTFRVHPHVILGLGLFLSAFTALLPLLLGGAILEHGEVEFHLPVFDKVKITSALSFDLGVDFVVIGLILMAFAAFGEDLPDAPDAADDGSDDPDRPRYRVPGRSHDERPARVRHGVPVRGGDLPVAAATPVARS